MAAIHKNFKSFYRQISIVYHTILIGYVLFMAIIYMSGKKQVTPTAQPDLMMLYIYLFIGVLLYFAKRFLKKFFKRLVSRKKDIREKLNLYFTFFIINMALVEGYGFFNIIWFMSHHDFNFLILAGYALLLMLFLKPHPDKIADLLQFSKDEQIYINQTEKPFE